MDDEKQSKQQSKVDVPTPSDSSEMSIPSNERELEQSFFKANELFKKYNKDLNWLLSIRESVEEQYPFIAPSLIKKYKDFINKYPDDSAIIKPFDDLMDIYEHAQDNLDDNGDINLHYKKEIEKAVREVNKITKEIDLLNSLFPREEVAVKEGVETSDQFNFKELNQEVEINRSRVQDLKNSIKQITESDFNKFFNQKFLQRLTNYGIYIGQAEEKLNVLENETQRLAEKIKAGSLSDEEIQSSFIRLSQIADRISKYIDNTQKNIDDFNIDISKQKLETEDLGKKFIELAEKLEAHAKEKFYAVKDGKTKSLELAQKIKQSLEGNITKELLDNLVREAEENIFMPEERSQEQHQKMLYVYEKLPIINKDKEKILSMLDGLEAFDIQVRKLGKKAGDELEKSKQALSKAYSRNDILQKMLSQVKKITADEIKENLQNYDSEIAEAENNFQAVLPKINKIAKQEIGLKLDWTLNAPVNKDLISSNQKAMLEGIKMLLDKSKDLSLEEIADLDDKINKVVEEINEQKKFFEKGEQESRVREKEYAQKPSRVVAPTKSESMPGIREVEKDLEVAPVSPKEIQRGIAEMLAKEGVIDIEPQKILSLFSETEINSLVGAVKKDVLSKTENNREDFNDLFREVLGERILNQLEKSKREQMTEIINEQVYSLLRGAVEAESQKEIAVLQAGKASALGKVGSFAARMAPQLAMAAGIGIGAGLIIGSGGAAAAVAGASIGLVRVLNKKIAKSEIFQKAKEKVGSFWGRTVGKLFKKEKPPVDNDKVISETADKYINKDVLAVILSNQLRENSSQDLIKQVQVFAEDKHNALRNPTPELIEKFSASLEESSREFFKNSYNYLLTRFPDESEERIAKMATQMALTTKMYQRNEVLSAEALAKADEKVKAIEDKGWLVNSMEKFFKFRSEGAGAVLFGGALGYFIAETSSTGRVVSGALAGAGLGLMIEKKTRMAEDEKLKKTIEKTITDSEKKLFGREITISEKDFAKAKKDSSDIRSKLDMGFFDDDLLLKNRAENFIARVNKMAMEKFEAPKFSIDDLLVDINKQTKKLEKENEKNLKKILKSFDTKDRALVYMGVGAVVGGLAGYAGAKLADYLRAPEGETIAPTEKDLGVGATEKRFFGGAIYPAEQLTPPETPLTPIPPETPLTPIETVEDAGSEHIMELEKVVGHRRAETIVTALERAKITQPAFEATPAISGTGDVLNVHQVYSAGIKDVRLQGMGAGEPVYFTKDEAFRINQLMTENKTDEMLELLRLSQAKGPVYEDLTTGKQYHANELDFTEIEKSKPPLYGEEEVYGPRPKLDIKNPYDEDMPEPRVRPEAPRPRLNIENPYDEPVMTVEQIRAVGRPEGMSVKDFNAIMKEIPQSGVTSEQYNTMIDIYNKTGANMATRYIGYVEAGQMGRANAVLELANTIGEVDAQPIHMETEPVAPIENELTPEPAPEPAPEPEPVAETKTSEGELTEEQAEIEEEESDDFTQEVKEIVASRERALVNELKGANAPKAREAYDWLAENKDNPEVSKLHRKFVEDMLDDNKIKPSLLKQINVLRESM
jgi:hypothetical protein